MPPDIIEAAGLTAAMATVRHWMQQTADPDELSGFIAQIGEYALERLGFTVNSAADVQIDNDESPDRMRITLTWPLPSPLENHHAA